MPEDTNIALVLDVLKDVRNEVRHQRTLLLESLDQGRTAERAMEAHLLGLHQRLGELKEELEQTIKGEIAMLLDCLETDREGRGMGGG